MGIKNKLRFDLAAQNIHNYRLMNSLTCVEFGDECGLSASTINRAENGLCWRLKTLTIVYHRMGLEFEDLWKDLNRTDEVLRLQIK